MGQTLGKLQDSSSHKRIEGHRRGSAQMTGKLQTIDSSVGSVPTNALVASYSRVVGKSEVIGATGFLGITSGLP
jgi:hypothetical protein